MGCIVLWCCVMKSIHVGNRRSLFPQGLVFLKVLLILLACLWIYAPVFHGEWLWDDDYLLTNNPAMSSVEGLWGIWFLPTTADYLPISLTALWIQWRFFGMDSTGYHLASVLLHAMGACLVWLLFHRLKIRFAWVGGLIFAIHPLCVESVAWVSEIKNTLSLPFFLLAAICYVRFEENAQRRDYLLALFFFLAAMLSKSSVVMFPVLILLYAWWKRGRIDGKDIFRSAPFFLISLCLGLITLFFQLGRAIGSEPIPIGAWDSRLAIAGMAVLFYISNIFWPFHLLPIYPQWAANPPSPVQFFPLLVIGIVFGLFWFYRKTWGRHALMGFGFFLIALFPVLGFVPMSYMRVGWVSDHFLYLPMIGMIGWSVAGAGLIYEDAAPVVKSLVMALSILVGVVLMESTRSYAEIWQNEDRMWLYTMKYNWNCWQAHNRYGSRLFNRGNFDEALKHFTIATELRPDLAETQNNLGSAVLAQKDTKRAVKHFREGLRLSPEIIAIKSNLARALFLDGQYGEALPIYKELATKFPKNAAFQCNLGVIEYQLGNYEASVRAFKQALEIDPGLEDAKRNLEQVLRDLKKSGL